jgi:hypothetical protein
MGSATRAPHGSCNDRRNTNLLNKELVYSQIQHESDEALCEVCGCCVLGAALNKCAPRRPKSFCNPRNHEIVLLYPVVTRSSNCFCVVSFPDIDLSAGNGWDS